MFLLGCLCLCCSSGLGPTGFQGPGFAHISRLVFDTISTYMVHSTARLNATFTHFANDVRIFIVRLGGVSFCLDGIALRGALEDGGPGLQDGRVRGDVFLRPRSSMATPLESSPRACALNALLPLREGSSRRHIYVVIKCVLLCCYFSVFLFNSYVYVLVFSSLSFLEPQTDSDPCVGLHA